MTTETNLPKFEVFDNFDNKDFVTFADETENNNTQDESTTVYVDNLLEDPELPGQQYALVSFIDPDKIKNTKIRGIKIRGCFNTLEEAQFNADKLRKFDPYFDVYVLSVGKWGAWNPDPYDTDKVKDVNHDNEVLNDIMGQHIKNMDKAKDHAERRKNDKILTETANGMNSTNATSGENKVHNDKNNLASDQNKNGNNEKEKALSKKKKNTDFAKKNALKAAMKQRLNQNTGNQEALQEVQKLQNKLQGETDNLNSNDPTKCDSVLTTLNSIGEFLNKNA